MTKEQNKDMERFFFGFAYAAYAVALSLYIGCHAILRREKLAKTATYKAL